MMDDRIKLEHIGFANTWTWEEHMAWATRNMAPEQAKAMWAEYSARRTAKGG